MKVRDLKHFIDESLKIRSAPHRQEEFLDSEVSIVLSEPSIGSVAMSEVKSVHSGFDWENGHILIYAEDDLVRLKEKEHLWQLAHDFIYMLSEDGRYYKGVKKESELAKRAKRIIEASKGKK